MNTGLGVQKKSLEGNFQLRDYPKSGLSNTDYRILPDTYFNRNDNPESKIVQLINLELTSHALERRPSMGKRFIFVQTELWCPYRRLENVNENVCKGFAYDEDYFANSQNRTRPDRIGVSSL